MKNKISGLIGRFERLAPPGYDWKGELKWLLAALTAAFLWTFGFIIRFAAAHEELFIYDHYLGKRFLQADRMMDPFLDVVGGSFKGYTVFAVLLIAVIVLHYMYFFRGSRSIYTMRRLKRKSETWKRCIITPVIWLLICIFSALIVLAIDFAIYIIATPKACLPSGQLGITLRYLAEVFI
ncbi:MAG: hypothetical protein IKM51_04275 [Oscillospiraceae bacterium]|nr:hypothetical protein [Oscillospiraceae bacterium]